MMSLTYTQAHCPLWIYVRNIPYEHLQETESADPKIDEVTTYASLSLGRLSLE